MKKVLVTIFVFLIITILFAATEDLSTYTIVDSDSGPISASASRLTLTNVNTTYHDEYVYYDYGANHFSENFTHQFTLNCGSFSQYEIPHIWLLANDIEDARYLRTNDKTWLEIRLQAFTGNDPEIVLSEWVGGVDTNDDTAFLTEPWTYYFTVIRDEAVGTYGTLYAYIYSDAERTTGIDTLVVTLTAKNDFRYLYLFNVLSDNSSGRLWDGYIENLDIGETTKNSVIIN